MRYKKCTRIITVIMLGICMMIPGIRASAESYREDAPFDIEVHYGFEDTVRIGKDASFHVSLYNKAEDFTGTIRLMTAAYSEDGYYYSSVTGLPFFTTGSTKYYDNCGYEKPLEISSGTTKIIHFALPYDSCAPFVKILVADEQGEILTEKIVRISIRTSYSEILIGALTDRFQELEYMDGMHLKDYPGVSVSLVSIGPEQLQDNNYGLDMLDVVLVHAYDMENMKTEQKQVLERWVRQGGTMVTDQIIIDEVTSQNIGAVGKKLYGNGMILTYTGNFAGNDDQDSSMLTQLMKDIYTPEALSNMDSGSYYFTSEDYWDIMGHLEGIDEEIIPQIWPYIIVLAVYTFLAGPIVYLVLKKFKVRKYLWGCVAGLAMIFSVGVFLMGKETRFTAPFVNYVRLLYLSDGYEDETVEWSVQAPYNQPYQIFVNKAYDVFPVTEIDYYSVSELPAGDFERESVRIVYGEEENRLDIASSPAFSERYFRSERINKTDDSGVLGLLNYFDSQLTGMIQNNTRYDLANTFVFFRNHLVYIGDFASGSSKDMREHKMYFFSPGYGYDLITGLMEVPEGYVEEVTDEFLDVNWKKSLLNNYLMEGYHSGEERCILVGFTENTQLNLLNDSAYKTYGQTMVITDLELNMVKEIGNTIWEYDPFVTSSAKAISGNYGTYENICYSQETILEFTLPKDLMYMQVEFVDEKYFDTEMYRAFGGEIEIYHPTDDLYVKLNESRLIDWEELNEYITEDGTLVVKFRRKSDVQDKYEKLPVVIARGRNIHAED